LNTRQWQLFGALVLTLGATAWSALQDPDAEVAARSPAPAPRAGMAATAPRPAAPRIPLNAEASAASDRLPELPDATVRVPLAEVGADFAAPISFRPPPVSTPMPKRMPMAPPLPFRYVGAIDDGGTRRALLMEGEQLRVVAGGDEIDGRYRVERVGEAGIDFLYLPLKQRQSLTLSRS
jgi:hypothetical protein